MNHLLMYTLCACCLLMAACSSSRKKDQQDLAGEKIVQDTTKKSLAHSALPETEAPIPSIPPAPGSAKVTAEILSVEPSTRGFNCTLKIIEVHGYGASTPPLPAGTEIEASVSNELLQSIDNSDNPGNIAEKVLPSGVVKELTLKFMQTPNLPGARPASWRVLSIQ